MFDRARAINLLDRIVLHGGAKTASPLICEGIYIYVYMKRERERERERERDRERERRSIY